MADKIYYIVTQVKLYDDFKHIRRLRFPLDGEKDLCYRSRVSFSAFYSSKKRYNYEPSFKEGKYLWHCQREFDFNLSKQLGHVRELPIEELPDLWTLYKAIGYDYKNKKWINYG